MTTTGGAPRPGGISSEICYVRGRRNEDDHRHVIAYAGETMHMHGFLAPNRSRIGRCLDSGKEGVDGRIDPGCCRGVRRRGGGRGSISKLRAAAAALLSNRHGELWRGVGGKRGN